MNEYVCVRVFRSSISVSEIKKEVNVAKWSGDIAAHGFKFTDRDLNVKGWDMNDDDLQCANAIEFVNSPFYKELKSVWKEQVDLDASNYAPISSILGMKVSPVNYYMSGILKFFRKDPNSQKWERIDDEAAWGEKEYASWY